MNSLISLSIDGKNIQASEGKTILEAALENDIYIPHLCHAPDLKPVGVCRLCMVDVGRGPVISCKTHVSSGMVVKTKTPQIDNIRKVALMLLINNNDPDQSSSKLRKVVDYIGLDPNILGRLRKSDRKPDVDDSNPFFSRNMNKCILCGICVRACDEIEGVNAIDFLSRGYDTTIGTFGNEPIKESVCESCGECVVRCPVDSLSFKEFEKPTKEVLTTCVYCGVGCGLYLGIKENKIVSARGDPDNSINKGILCVKGRFGNDFVNSPDRLTSPLMRREGKLVEVSWEEALDYVADKLKNLKGDQFGFIASAKCTNEDNYVMQKFARAVMKTNNVDHCARLCHAPTVAGLVQSFGSGAMTNSINEITKAKSILAIGTNTTQAHPVIGLKIKEAVRNGAKLIVANPKEIDLCKHATIYLQHKPGTDVALLMGMMKVIVDEGLFDSDFIADRCENFEAFRQSLEDYGAEFVEKTTGVSQEKFSEAARVYTTTKPSSLLFSMGITQHTHGTDNVLAISNLAMLTGNVGKESTGVNPLRGQNNVQGACDLGGLPNVYPGYQKVDNVEIHDKFESAWKTKLSDKPGLAMTEMFKNLKAIYLVGENPIIAEADSSKVKEAIENLDFFVVQDIFLTETAAIADVVLPATTFAEKDGTFTNTERRIQRVRKAIDWVGNSLPDWEIICKLAAKMKEDGFDFKNPSEIMDEIAKVTPIYGGISYDRIDKVGLQWPCPDKNHAGTKYLHKDKFARGKGRFFELIYKPSKELPDKDYPLMLTTDRSIYHFHTGTMTRKVKGLDELNKEELVKLNPVDAEKLGISDSEKVKIRSRRGEITSKVKITDIVPPGLVSMTFHFFESPTNVLTNAALDPVAKIPETKICAVKVEKI